MTASVVAVYRNETLELIQAMLHSVLWHTPPALLGEIILVDDHNEEGAVQGDIEALGLPKLTVLRNPIREGLVRSRLIGASVATSPVLVFLDTHSQVRENDFHSTRTGTKMTPCRRTNAVAQTYHRRARVGVRAQLVVCDPRMCACARKLD